MWAAISESRILRWQDSTANLFSDFCAIRSLIVPDPKQETYSARPFTIPSTGLTTCVA